MNRFLQRQLFAQDLLVIPDDNKSISKTISLAKDHGGVVLDNSKQFSDLVTVVLLSSPPENKMLEQLTKHFPKAEIVRANWVEDSVNENRRLDTAVYRFFSKPTVIVQPPTKRHKISSATQETIVACTSALSESNLLPWRTIQNSLYVLDARSKQQQEAPASAYKIAGFDLDGTLIVTKSGNKFAKSTDDWKWFHASLVREKLAELARDGYTLIIFSNQNGVAKGHVSAAEVQRKLETIIRQLKLPMLAFLGTKNDIMRKPRLGAWMEMIKLLNAKGEISVDKKMSFYCGDAAGRPKVSGRAKDFAATDYKFALNAGIRFFTPEALFLASKQRIHTNPDTWELGFDPKSIAKSDYPVFSPSSAQVAKRDQEIIVLVGPQASGKSFFAKQYLDTYVAVSQDELRSVANCKTKCLEALEKKNSVVIDNTNRDPWTRKEWIAIAQKKNIPIRCFVMDVGKPISMHLNTFRALKKQKNIPPVAIHGFYKNFVAPTVDEGFAEVVEVQFCINYNFSEADQTLLQSYL
ncbi:putative BRCT domain, HAD-superfamily hydrolase,subfamily IIIA, polynucleotide kinase 3 phosphatase [Plasmopara halstedii]